MSPAGWQALAPSRVRGRRREVDRSCGVTERLSSALSEQEVGPAVQARWRRDRAGVLVRENHRRRLGDTRTGAIRSRERAARMYRGLMRS